MGIAGIWDVLGNGEITSIAQLASDHFRRTGRPLRIAVDEAGWRFCNLNPHQVRAIREKEPAANPVEKAIIFRILKLLKLNIRLLFIFDGPSRPWKKGKTAGMIKFKDIALLRRVLDLLRVPHHRAPAEAEAECARLQQEGIVDAVWSEDSDSLMFGCTFLIRNYRDKDKNKKSDTHVRVHRARDILEQKKLDREGLVLFAMLSGGDYDTVGVIGCGPHLAHRAAAKGLGKILCETPDMELPYFRRHLEPIFRGKDVNIPYEWPRARHLNNYRNPKVSTVAELHDLKRLRDNGWDREIDQSSLRDFLRERFQVWTKGFLKHIAPILLVRKLSDTASAPEGSDDANSFSVEVVRPRGKKNTDISLESALERRIKFLPHRVVDFNITMPPENEDWSKLATKADGEFDPNVKIDCEVLEVILRRSLPASVFETPPPASSAKRGKRRAQDQDNSDVDAPEATASSRKKQGATEEARKRSRTTKNTNYVDVLDLTDDLDKAVGPTHTYSSGTRHSRGDGGREGRDYTLGAPSASGEYVGPYIFDPGSESEDELPSLSELLSQPATPSSRSRKKQQKPPRTKRQSVPGPDPTDEDLRLARELQAKLDAELTPAPETSVQSHKPVESSTTPLRLNPAHESRQQIQKTPQRQIDVEPLSARDAVRAHWASFNVKPSDDAAMQEPASTDMSQPRKPAYRKPEATECIDLTSD